MLNLKFTFTETCWLWMTDRASWHFVTVPKIYSEEIKFFTDNHNGNRRGWCAVRVNVTIGSSEWKTSIFPSKRLDTYLLPIKLEMRKKEKILVDNMVEVTLNIKV